MGIETGNFRLVAQCLIHLPTASLALLLGLAREHQSGTGLVHLLFNVWSLYLAKITAA